MRKVLYYFRILFLLSFSVFFVAKNNSTIYYNSIDIPVKTVEGNYSIKKENLQQKWNNKKCPKFAGVSFYQNGRLGNKISSYTNLIIMEWIFGIEFFIPKFMKNYLGNIFKNVTYNTAPSNLSIINENFKTFVTNNLTTWNNNGSVDCLRNPQQLLHLSGRHYVPLGSFADFRNDDLVNCHLEFVDKIQNKAQGIFHRIKQSLNKNQNTGLEEVFVGIHVRRGDWEQHFWDFRKRNVTTVDESYFNDAMDYYRSRYKGVLFLFVSDDMGWCRETFTGSDIFYAGGNSPPVDLCLLSKCNHSVVSYGTFGAWGAFLAGGDVVVPARRHRRCSTQLEGFPQIGMLWSTRYLFSCRDVPPVGGN